MLGSGSRAMSWRIALAALLAAASLLGSAAGSRGAAGHGVAPHTGKGALRGLQQALAGASSGAAEAEPEEVGQSGRTLLEGGKAFPWHGNGEGGQVPHELRSRSDARSLLSPIGSGYWSVKGSNFVDEAGRTVYFSGVIWSGFETKAGVVHGLAQRSLESHLDQMKALGFNLIRLPFAGDTLLSTTYPRASDLNYALNPKLKGLNSLHVMDNVIAQCYYRGIKVILDYHRIHQTNNNELGLWWDAKVGPDVFLNNWVFLAKRYKNNPIVIGADLFNEVHPCNDPICPPGAPYWNYKVPSSREKFNWRQWAYRTAVAIQKVEPRWIIFIEGFGGEYWWGGDVRRVLQAPFTLPVRNKLAYSSHEYGPYVYDGMSFFKDPSFPRNMFPIFEKYWGYVIKQKIAPVWVGEFGSFFPPGNSRKNVIERQHFQTLLNYMRSVQASWTIAFWDPTSKDTGSVLNKDWRTPNKQKMALLAPIMHKNFGPSK